MTTWAEQYVDRQVEDAWLKLRLDLADHCVAALAAGAGEPLDFTTENGKVLTVGCADDHVIVQAGSQITATANVDEAAFEAVRILREDWKVVHPVFVGSALVASVHIPDNPISVVVPAGGQAASVAELQAWVEAAFQERVTGPLKVSPRGVISWRTRRGGRVEVKVRNAGRIELQAVIGRQVGFGKARKVIDELSRRYFGLKFFLIQDRLVMSQVVIASPFVPDQLHSALGTFVADVDQLNWVAEKVLRKRVRIERASAAQAMEDGEAAKARLAAMQAEFATVMARLAAAEDEAIGIAHERDAAQAELAKMKRMMERALGHRTFPQRHAAGGAA